MAGKTEYLTRGRASQKERTRRAIVDATRELIRTGVVVAMPEISRAAAVSEATAYRYFPDLATLLREAMDGVWPGAEAVMAPMAEVEDPVERVGFATEYLLRHVDACAGAVRAMIAASIIKPGTEIRPGLRRGLIECALAPATDIAPDVLAALTHDLTVIMSAEALFTLVDLGGLSTEEAIGRVVSTARTVTAARLAE